MINISILLRKTGGRKAGRGGRNLAAGTGRLGLAARDDLVHVLAVEILLVVKGLRHGVRSE